MNKRRAGFRFRRDSRFHWYAPGRQSTADERAVFGVGDAIAPAHAWVEIDFAPGWRAAYRLFVWAGAPVVAEVRVFPADEYRGRQPGTWRVETVGIEAGSDKRVVRRETPLGEEAVFQPVRHGITARLYHSVKIGDHRAYAGDLLAKLKEADSAIRRELTPWNLKDEPGFSASLSPSAPASAVLLGPVSRSPSRRLRGKPDRFYAILARDYRDRIAAGSRRPVSDIAKSRGKSQSSIRDALNEARNRALLTRVGKTIIGGQLTPKAQAILANAALRRDRP